MGRTNCMKECDLDDSRPTCLQTHRREGVACTRTEHHTGPHVACGLAGHDLVTWHGDTVDVPTTDHAVGGVYGTRRLVQDVKGDWRVVCASCGAGGVIKYGSKDMAENAAVRDSTRGCSVCGAT